MKQHRALDLGVTVALLVLCGVTDADNSVLDFFFHYNRRHLFEKDVLIISIDVRLGQVKVLA